MDNLNDSNPDKAVQDAVFGSDSGDYFDALDKEVNGAVRDPGQEEPIEQATQEKTPDPVQEENQDTTTDWKKRYGDSSSEAQRLAAENKNLAPMKPLMNLMKTDAGLVDVIKNYISTGGKQPQALKDELQLDEDFVYDAHEAVTSPDSKSAKVFDTMVDRAVNKKVGDFMQREKSQLHNQTVQNQRKQETEDFKTKHNMTDADFNDMMEKAKHKKFTLEDMHFLLNKDSVTKNVANSTKQDMLNQMKNARDIPVSQANVNSAPKGEENPDNKVFDAILGLDSTFDDLFG